MIVEKVLNEQRVLHYSDKGMMIRQIETGVVYEDAEDNRPCIYTYEETDEPIPPQELTAEEALRIILGEVEE